MTYFAIEPFDHGQRFRRGDAIPDGWSEQTLKRLQMRGLIAPRVNPTTATGTTLSASPVAQASPEQTSKPSKRGAKRNQAEASSSPTTPTDSPPGPTASSE